MTRTAVLLLLASLAYLPAACAQEYLLEGRNRTQGDFTGRLTLTPGPAPGDYRADRKLELRQKVQELLGGTGSRTDWRLALKFTPGTGAAGAIAGDAKQDPITLKVEFEGDEDASISTRTLVKNKVVSRGAGFRVFLAEQTERPKPKGSATYKQFKGVAFLKGDGDAHEVDVNDVNQGGLGDCYFMAGIASVARTHPHRVRSMIETNADGTFSVYLWRHDYQWGEEVVGPDGTFIPQVKAQKIVVDDQFPAGWGTSPAYAEFGDVKTVNGVEQRELWPMILEKAYAKFKQSYEAIEGGWSSTPMSFFSGQDAVVDHDPTEMSEAELLEVLKTANDKGYPATLGVPKSESSVNLHGNHYYIFAGLDDQGRVKLLNPWGSSHPTRALTMAEVKKWMDSIHVGEF
ncbi:MAG: C2 family cysteine protease [Planctomycetota bacterium]